MLKREMCPKVLNKEVIFVFDLGLKWIKKVFDLFEIYLKKFTIRQKKKTKKNLSKYKKVFSNVV